jgi:hypothetical protein
VDELSIREAHAYLKGVGIDPTGSARRRGDLRDRDPVADRPALDRGAKRAPEIRLRERDPGVIEHRRGDVDVSDLGVDSFPLAVDVSWRSDQQRNA